MELFHIRNYEVTLHLGKGQILEFFLIIFLIIFAVFQFREPNKVDRLRAGRLCC